MKGYEFNCSLGTNFAYTKIMMLMQSYCKLVLLIAIANACCLSFARLSFFKSFVNTIYFLCVSRFQLFIHTLIYTAVYTFERNKYLLLLTKIEMYSCVY